jgi:invasion protein IalB
VVKPAEPKNAKSQAFVWQRCLNGICEAARKITGKEVSDLTAAGTVLFGYKMQANGNPIVVKISMEKFGEGLAAIEATATQ